MSTRPRAKQQVTSLLQTLLTEPPTYPGLPWWLSGKESACNAGDPASIPGLGRSPWRRKWPHTPVFLPGESHGWRSLVGYSLWGHKESNPTHPPGLLQLLRQLSQGLAMALPQLLHCHLMNARLFLQSLLQLRHLLFSLGPFIGEGGQGIEFQNRGRLGL